MRKIGEDTLFHIFKQGHNKKDEVWEPKVDIFETSSQLFIRIALAGVQKDSISITFSEAFDCLVLKGERKEPAFPNPVKYHRLEIYYGSFEKQIAIPSGIFVDPNTARADFNKGILTIELTKKENITTQISIDG
ncbi:MAG: Hsp20/alpha crystallin family protein [Abditibacteriota bacterium]|nr:Hsp20/alpha crystallin family protein [Abditibacteriota bacterium]